MLNYIDSMTTFNDTFLFLSVFFCIELTSHLSKNEAIGKTFYLTLMDRHKRGSRHILFMHIKLFSVHLC